MIRARGGASLTSDLARLAIAGLVGISAFSGFAILRIWQEGSRDSRPDRADAIVVLGAAQEHGRPKPVLAARLDHAIRLYRTGIARHFVVTGGTAQGDVLSEAEVARRYVVQRGVPDTAILAETKGHDTLSSLSGVRDVFSDRNLNSAVFVSDETHMLRVLLIARDLGIVSWGSPARDSPTDREPLTRGVATLHELLALGEYFLLRR